MNQAEATTEADNWEADINSARVDANVQLEKTLSTTRARAGASGVRKGSQSWNTMMYNAAQPYNNVLAELDSEAHNVAAFRGIISSLSRFPSSSGTAPAREIGGSDTTSNPEPGAGYGKGPTTAEQEVAQGIGLGVSEFANEVTMGTMGAIGAMRAGLNMTGIGMVANTAATVGGRCGSRLAGQTERNDRKCRRTARSSRAAAGRRKRRGRRGNAGTDRFAPRSCSGSRS